ncbi:MAG: isoleucine--tRNA ligase [Dehalococcoidia bacterium]
MFRSITGKPNFPDLEEKLLAFWNEQQIFRKSVDQRLGGPSFMLYEGPPTVNANPGIHHVLSRVFKDIFPRYRSMKGFHAPRKAGWDTHGLPVELEVEEDLGFSSKKDIEDYGIGKFNEKCRERVLQHIEEWNRLTERIGFWIDLDNPYKTLDMDYVESCWWAIKQLWEKGLIYKGYRVTPHCPRCGTSLSSHEVAQGYQENTPDPSVYILFRLSQKAQPAGNKEALEKLGWDGSQWKTERPSFLVWTTTPWTLTANVALAVNPNETYVLVQTRSQEGLPERVILAEALLDKALGSGNWEILERASGSELVGFHYERLYEPGRESIVNNGELVPEGNRVLSADFVSMEEGTGIVHIAPAYGQEDYELGEQESLPVVHTIDLGGHVRLPGGDWHGKFVKDADPFILDDLKSRGLLFHKETITHTYPFCWRCDTPLIYYAKPSWYIKTTAKQDKLIEANDKINWYPEHIKRGRFGDWLRNNVDWAFSRERYWGTPLPVWQCPDCGRQQFIGSIKDLKSLSSGYEPPDLHRPYVDRVTLTCQCGGRMEHVPDVIDCWFDSGAMPFAQWHYPFENKRLEDDGRFPADYICEAVDQTRGWFYSLHALSVALFDEPCYKNVICLGHILDANGEKMSKSKGNVVEPWEIINNYGADALRWYLITSAPAGNVYRFAPEFIADGLRRFLMTLWNTYSFFITYANIDNFDPREAKAPEQRPELDRWIISELHQLIREVTASLDNYDATSAGRRIEGFVDDLSNWYIRRSRRRFWKSENDTDKQSAHVTLYECLTTLAKLLAPLTPFIAEEIYQNLVLSCYPEEPQSVHLSDFPVFDAAKIDEELSSDTKLAMKIASLGRSARSKAGIKVRQPLAKAVAKVRANSETRSLKRLEHQILDELNVKELVVTTNEKELVDFEIKPNLPLLGPKYGKGITQISAALPGLPQDEVASRVKAGKEVEVNGYVLQPDEILVSTTSKPDFSVAEEGDYVVGVTTQVSQELADEGLVRELVHRLQTMRRSAGFDIADYIETYYKGGETVQRVMENFATYVSQETLSRDLIEDEPPSGAYTETHSIDGNKVILAVKK